MRAFAACLTVFLGLGGLTALVSTMSACSDATDAGGAGGASGASTAAGASSGGASAGTGGAACSFASSDCTGCLGTKCGEQVVACQGDADCKAALAKLTPCACGGTAVDDCKASFYTDGGDPAEKLVDCYTVNNCDSACQ